MMILWYHMQMFFSTSGQTPADQSPEASISDPTAFIEGWLVDHPRTYGEEIRDRLEVAEAARHQLIVDALENGITAEELPGLIADAISNDALPRVFRGETQSYFVELMLLDGPIESNELHVELAYDQNGSVHSSYTILNLSHFDAPDGGDRLQYTGLLPLGTTASPDQAVIRLIDTYM
jgi:hypothetical protein